MEKQGGNQLQQPGSNLAASIWKNVHKASKLSFSSARSLDSAGDPQTEHPATPFKGIVGFSAPTCGSIDTIPKTSPKSMRAPFSKPATPVSSPSSPIGADYHPSDSVSHVTPSPSSTSAPSTGKEFKVPYPMTSTPDLSSGPSFQTSSIDEMGPPCDNEDPFTALRHMDAVFRGMAHENQHLRKDVDQLKQECESWAEIIHNRETDIESKSRQLVNMEKQLTKSQMNQELAEKLLKDAREQLTSLKTEVETLKAEYKEAVGKAETLSKDVAAADQHICDLKHEIEVERLQYNSMKSAGEILKQELENLKVTSASDSAKYDSDLQISKVESAEKNNTIESLNAEKNDLLLQVTRCTARLEEMEKRIAEVLSKNENLEDLLKEVTARNDADDSASSALTSRLDGIHSMQSSLVTNVKMVSDLPKIIAQQYQELAKDSKMSNKEILDVIKTQMDNVNSEVLTCLKSSLAQISCEVSSISSANKALLDNMKSESGTKATLTEIEAALDRDNNIILASLAPIADIMSKLECLDAKFAPAVINIDSPQNQRKQLTDLQAKNDQIVNEYENEISKLKKSHSDQLAAWLEVQKKDQARIAMIENDKKKLQADLDSRTESGGEALKTSTPVPSAKENTTPPSAMYNSNDGHSKERKKKSVRFSSVTEDDDLDDIIMLVEDSTSAKPKQNEPVPDAKLTSNKHINSKRRNISSLSNSEFAKRKIGRQK